MARSTISRLVNGRTVPSPKLAEDVTAALSRRLGRPLDPRDVFSPDGAYPTPSGCSLCSCHGCLPAGRLGRRRRAPTRVARPASRRLVPGAAPGGANEVKFGKEAA